MSSRVKSILSFYSFETFSHQDSLMVFPLGLSDNKSPQVFRILLSILANLNNAVFWMVSTRPTYSQVPHSLYRSFVDRTKLHL